MWGAIPTLAASGDWAPLLLLSALVAIGAANAAVWWFWGLGKSADVRSAERALAGAHRRNAVLVVENERLAAQVDHLHRHGTTAHLSSRIEGQT